MGSPSNTPTRIGKYEVTGVVGRGGMGTVYKATDSRIGRPVAIKILSGAYDDDPELLARFYREAKSTGSLQHQNIVTVYELGDQDGIPYLVMEYLEGQSLDSLLSSKKPLRIAEKLDIVVQVCNGLTFAHQRGVVHRDIKPANIMVLPDGTAKIVDFGIAHVGGKKLTRTGQVIGSIYYMSPEQLNGNLELDRRTDVYSTGVVLFQLLTGALPFEGQDTGSTLLKIVHDPPPPLSNFLKTCPPELEAINQKALAKDREARYASAEDFGFELSRLQQQLNRETLAEYLEEASQALRREDFTSARQHLLQVLRAEPQSTEAKTLLRQVQQAIDARKRKQQVRQYLTSAVEAFSRKDFDEALRYVDEGLETLPGDTDLIKAQAKVLHARDQLTKYRDALNAAQTALKNSELDEARDAANRATAILPDENEAQALLAVITEQLKERERKDKAAQAARQFAMSVNAVEKAMADARMLLFLNQRQEAIQALVKVEREAALVPTPLRLQWETLKREVSQEKNLEPVAAPIPPPVHDHTPIFKQPMSPGSDEPDSGPAATLLFSLQPAPSEAENSGRADEASRNSQLDAIPDDLREFLPPPQADHRRRIFGIGMAVLILAGLVYWIAARPRTESTAKTTPASNGSTAPANSSVPPSAYAEINAEPWATVRNIVTPQGETVRAVNDQTPIRVELPPGQYEVTLDGPNGQQKRVRVEVPEAGGKSYFVVFHKPDVAQILSNR
jgi:serine/threonine protein kinase